MKKTASYLRVMSEAEVINGELPYLRYFVWEQSARKVFRLNPDARFLAIEKKGEDTVYLSIPSAFQFHGKLTLKSFAEIISTLIS